MFKITHNTFSTNGVCKYADEHGNTVFMKRDENNITAKLRIASGAAKVDPVYVSVPFNESGVIFHIAYLREPSNEEKTALKEVIVDFSTLIEHWISMLYDINFLAFPTDKLLQMPGNEKATEEDVSYNKWLMLSQYEELTELCKSIDKKNSKIIDHLSFL